MHDLNLQFKCKHIRVMSSNKDVSQTALVSLLVTLNIFSRSTHLRPCSNNVETNQMICTTNLMFLQLTLIHVCLFTFTDYVGEMTDCTCPRTVKKEKTRNMVNLFQLHFKSFSKGSLIALVISLNVNVKQSNI